MAFNPNLPAANSPILSAELRGQFNGLQENIQARAFEDDCVNRTLGCAVNPASVGLLDGSEDLSAVIAKVNELVTALKR